MTDEATRPNQPAVEPAIIVIFGVTGDLSRRYLLPALYRLFKYQLLGTQTRIIGLSRRQLDMDELFQGVELCVNETDNICDPATLAAMRAQTSAYQLDMGDPAGYRQLKIDLDAIEATMGVAMNRLFYLSIPPAAYSETIGFLGQAGLNGTRSRLLVEKPFGHDLSSAEALINLTASHFQEEQVYRIDHYLAKETVQNIITFRFENPLFEAVWNNRHVSSIDILASEKIGIEGRAVFYEQQGALRDFIQNHLLQLLAVATMDEPEHLDSAGIHDMKLRLMQAILPAEPEQARRGQYAGYRDEVHNPASNVETYAAIRTGIDNNRWRGVPVTIRTGKALADRKTVITFTFKKDATGLVANTLQFRIQPDEGIALNLLAKKPGFDHELLPVAMDFAYNQHFDGEQPAAYERVLLDAVRGDRTLFASGPEVLAAWRIVEPVVTAWQGQGSDNLRLYQPGTASKDL